MADDVRKIRQHGHTGPNDGGVLRGVNGSSGGTITPATPATPPATTAESVSVSDIAGNFSGDNVEEVLAELAATTGGVTYGTPALTLGTSNTAGSTDEAIRRDATILVFDATAPSTQALGDSAAVGAATVAARRDHKHAMPSFATPAIVLGSSAAAGSAATPIRSDSTIAAFDATVPVTQASGDSAATGSAAFAARRDHKHGMPSLVSLSASTPVQDGGAGAGGSGTAASKDDHKHPGDKVAIVAVIDGGGSAITTGVKLDISVPFACTITGARTLADTSGSIVIDVWKDTYANYPPVVGDSITASAKPTLSSATKADDTTLTGWTTTVTAGDTLRFNVDSASTVTRVTLTLTATRT